MFSQYIIGKLLFFCGSDVTVLRHVGRGILDAPLFRRVSNKLLDGGAVERSCGMIFAVEGLRAVAAVPSTAKIIPQDLTYSGAFRIRYFNSCKFVLYSSHIYKLLK